MCSLQPPSGLCLVWSVWLSWLAGPEEMEVSISHSAWNSSVASLNAARFLFCECKNRLVSQKGALDWIQSWGETMDSYLPQTECNSAAQHVLRREMIRFCRSSLALVVEQSGVEIFHLGQSDTWGRAGLRIENGFVSVQVGYRSNTVKLNSPLGPMPTSGPDVAALLGFPEGVRQAGNVWIALVEVWHCSFFSVLHVWYLREFWPKCSLKLGKKIFAKTGWLLEN